MKRRTLLALGLALLWLARPEIASACPLCYGGDDPETGRAALWAGAFLVTTVYGLLLAAAVWTWLRLRRGATRGDFS